MAARTLPCAMSRLMRDRTATLVRPNCLPQEMSHSYRRTPRHDTDERHLQLQRKGRGSIQHPGRCRFLTRTLGSCQTSHPRDVSLR